MPVRCRSRWENLDRGQYPFQPVKFMNLVAPSPCETKPYNKTIYLSLFCDARTQIFTMALMVTQDRKTLSAKVKRADNGDGAKGTRQGTQLAGARAH